MRITKQMLKVRLDNINRRLGRDYCLTNVPEYGGWTLTCNDDSTVIQHNIPPKQMVAYLNGIITGIDMRDGAYK